MGPPSSIFIVIAIATHTNADMSSMTTANAMSKGRFKSGSFINSSDSVNVAS
jgi:hypothetical protein